MLHHYELLYIVPAQYTDDELAPVKQKVRNAIEKAGGKISLEDNLGKKKLAYPIKKMFQGYYLLNYLEMESSALTGLDRDLRLTSEILRHIIVRYEPKAAIKLETIRQGMSETPEKSYGAEKREEISFPKEKEESQEEKKVDLKELDKKLDEILKTDNLL